MTDRKKLENQLNTVEEAIESFREGEFVIVVDDEDRENEGDFIIAAEKVTAEKVNFMMRYGRGVLCAPISEKRCEELELPMQVVHNTSSHEAVRSRSAGPCLPAARTGERRAA